MMTDTCGPMSPTPFAYYDPDTSSVRTSQATFPWDSTPSSPTLPHWGSMRGGELFERPTPVRLTAARDCSLLPTPTTDDAGNAYGRSNPAMQSLATEAVLLPTPKATNNDNQQNLDRYGPNLGMALMPELFEWTSAPPLLPTPTAVAQSGQCRQSGNYAAADLLHQMTCNCSAPTPQPSPDGNTSWDDQPLPLPNLDATGDLD